MKQIHHFRKRGLAAAAWGFIALVLLVPFVTGCQKTHDYELSDDILKNDDLEIYRDNDGNMTIRNINTKKSTIKDLKIEWFLTSPNDSFAVYCCDGRRGYFNERTGAIAIPAQYRRAWIFSEGVAAVQKNGEIGFIDHEGNVVIDFVYPYHGNPLSEFIFKDGHCVVANNEGKCGVIDKQGRWLIQPQYDDVNTHKEYAIVSNAGIRMQVDYEGHVLNSFVLDSVEELTYYTQERFENRKGELKNITTTNHTGLYAYRVGGRCGLMDKDCNRLTEPLYRRIDAVNDNMFRATLLDYFSEVILDAKGNVMK